VGRKVAQYSSNKVWAYKFVKRLEVAAAAISETFEEIPVAKSKVAKEWSLEMRYLADAAGKRVRPSCVQGFRVSWFRVLGVLGFRVWECSPTVSTG
jgi:hypothetical protein